MGAKTSGPVIPSPEEVTSWSGYGSTKTTIQNVRKPRPPSPESEDPSPAPQPAQSHLCTAVRQRLQHKVHLAPTPLEPVFVGHRRWTWGLSGGGFRWIDGFALVEVIKSVLGSSGTSILCGRLYLDLGCAHALDLGSMCQHLPDMNMT